MMGSRQYNASLLATKRRLKLGHFPADPANEGPKGQAAVVGLAGGMGCQPEAGPLAEALAEACGQWPSAPSRPQLEGSIRLLGPACSNGDRHSCSRPQPSPWAGRKPTDVPVGLARWPRGPGTMGVSLLLTPDRPSAAVTPKRHLGRAGGVRP